MTTVRKIAVHLILACDVFDGVFFFCCPFSPRDDLDEISDLIESVSEEFLPDSVDKHKLSGALRSAVYSDLSLNE